MRPQNRRVVERFSYSCPLLGLSMCTKYLKLKTFVYSVALVLIYSVGRKQFSYHKRPLQTSFPINDQIR